MRALRNIFYNRFSFGSNFYWEIGIDLGTSNTLVFLKERGVVIDEPTMLSRIKKKRWAGLNAPKIKQILPVAYGYKAKEMLNREPSQIEVVSPIKNGIISDLEAVESLVAYYLKLISEVPSDYPKIFKPRVIVGIPSFITEVQKRAVKSVFVGSGVKEVVMVESILLAGMGVGMPQNRNSGIFVIDIGGGKTEAAVVAPGGVVVGKSIMSAGKEIDRAIINFVRIKYGLLIGDVTAERVKIEVGNVNEPKEETKKSTLVRGRDLENGLPKSVKITEAEIREAIIFEVQKIVKLVKAVLDETPPELMEDILKRGLILTGNGSKLRGLDRLIEKEVKIPTRVTDDPGLSVIKGCGELMQTKASDESMTKLVLGMTK